MTTEVCSNFHDSYSQCDESIASIHFSTLRYHSNINNGQHTPKRVRFLDTVLLREIIHINDFTLQELQNSWYTSTECKEMKNQANLAVALLRLGKCSGDSSQCCQRGLEYRIGKNALRRNKIRLLGMLAVLTEQTEQDMINISDPIAIAQAYCSFSKKSSEIAYRIGLRDALEAAETHDLDVNIEKEKTGLMIPTKKLRLLRMMRKYTENKS
jgi:hypothetical protein